MSFHKQSRKYFNSIMKYKFEEGIFIDIKEESVFLGLDIQLEDLKEHGLKLLFRVENFDRQNIHKIEKNEWEVDEHDWRNWQ